MKINCLSCGHKVDLDDAYEEYEGHIRCLACSALLEVRTEEGRVKSVRIMNLNTPLAEEPNEDVAAG